MLLAPSPRNVTVSPASVPLCSRIVSRSASSWHGWKSSLSALIDRHRGARRHLLEPRLRVGAPDDRRDLPLEHARGVGRALLAAELAVRGRDDQRAAAEIGDADREADARARRRLVEDHRDGLRAGERRAPPAVGLDLLGEVEDRGLLGLGQVVVAEEVAGHVRSPGSVGLRMLRGRSAKMRSNSASSSSPMMRGGASRMRCSLAALMISPRGEGLARRRGARSARRGRCRAAGRGPGCR